MRRLAPAAAGSVVAILLLSTTALAHGCHQSWQQSGLQGWHRHGPKCETRKARVSQTAASKAESALDPVP